MRRIVSMMAAVAIILATSGAFALDTSVETGASKRTSREKSISSREAEEHGRSSEVTLALDALFRPVLLDLEKSTEPWKSCAVISHPLLPADIGLSAVDESGLVDTYKNEYINSIASNNAKLSLIGADENRLRQWRNCVSLYGAVIGQAYANLQTSLPKVARVAYGADAVTVSGLNREGMELLARMETEKVLAGAVKNKRIRQLYYKVIGNEEPCRFAGNKENIICGPVLLVIGPKASLVIGGVEYYGERFAGYGGQIRLHAGKNESLENVLALRRSREKDQAQKQQVSLSRLIPGVHE